MEKNEIGALIKPTFSVAMLQTTGKKLGKPDMKFKIDYQKSQLTFHP